MSEIHMDHLPATARRWLVQNREQFGTHDGLPGEFHREALYQSIGPRKRVVIVTPQGQLRAGRVVMNGPAGWVLNMGGSHGTPGIATEKNTVWVSGARKLKGGQLSISCELAP